MKNKLKFHNYVFFLNVNIIYSYSEVSFYRPRKILNLITTLICKIKSVQWKQHYKFALLQGDREIILSWNIAVNNCNSEKRKRNILIEKKLFNFQNAKWLLGHPVFKINIVLLIARFNFTIFNLWAFGEYELYEWS